MPEPGEGTPAEEAVDLVDVVEELSEALADTVIFKARAHAAHWNVKGPAFGAYHELFEAIYTDANDAIDPLAEQLLKLDVDAPSTLNEFAQRGTLKPANLSSDDPQVLARDLYTLNDALIVSLDDAFDCASDVDQQGLANFLAERLDMHRKWAWQLRRSLANAAEVPVVAPANPDESLEVENGEAVDMATAVYGRGLRIVGEAELRSTPSLIDELRGGAADVVEQRLAPSQVEIRSNADGTWQLEGLAAVFDLPSQDLGGFVEVLKRGSFKTVLRSSELDCRALINHDPNLILGRTTNGTLSLEETPRGLKYTVQVPDTSYGRDLRVLLERGDLSQSSFAFRVGQDGQEWAEDPNTGGLVRTITSVTALMDCSVVTYPAYAAATAGVANQTSSRSSEQGDPADAAEQVEQADDKSRRREEERARKERALRLRERLLKQ